MAEKKYLSENELKIGGAAASGTDAPVKGGNGKKYLSAEELAGLGAANASKAKPTGKMTHGAPLADVQGGKRVVVPQKPKEVPAKAAEKAPEPPKRPKVIVRPINDDKEGEANEGGKESLPSPAGSTQVALDDYLVKSRPAEKPIDFGAAASAVVAKPVEPPANPRIPPRKNVNTMNAVLSPMSGEVMNFLEASLPEKINTLDEAKCESVIKSLREGASYQIGPQIAKGAESLLYQGYRDGYNFLVKSIRNWKDHWLGDARTRNDVGKLNDSVSYETKTKHLNNEWSMGQQLLAEGNPVPVQMYSMRRVTRLGMELGWDLLMERINGIDLSEKRLLSVMTLADKVRVCIRMAQAIGALHLKKMIHLDIKPSNFMLDRKGNIRLIDFGISVPTGYQSRTVAGTAGYFSPEQISCKALGEDTDVFALGIAYSVLFGGKPLAQTPEEAKSRQFRHDALADLEKNTLSAIMDIPELNSVGKPLADVIRSCTVFRRANRIANCAVLITKMVAAAKECGIELLD